MSTTAGRVIVERDGGVGSIVFDNQAKRNAMSLEMWAQTDAALEALSTDAAVRVIVLSGAGGKAFLSGADISQFAEKRNNAEQNEAFARASDRSLRRLRECPKPTIAMIEGYCVGGGLAVATHADIRIASEESIFGIPAARLGIAYSFDKLSKLVELVGPAAAKDILFTGRRLQADEAHRIGLLTRVVPKATLRTAVSDYTTMIVENAPLSVQAAKFTIHQVTLPAGDRDMETVAGMARRCFDSRDYREGREAFAAKRRPEFVGE